MPKNTQNTNKYVVEEIPINLIDTEDQKVRDVQVDDDIHELASSIDALDLLQFPGVIRLPHGRYQLAWGRRRLEAFKMRQAKTIPCRIYNGDLQQVRAVALVENLQRRAMSVEEESLGVIYLLEEKHLGIDEIVKILGRTRSWVNQRLAIPQLPEEVREPLLNGEIGIGAAEAIAICEDPATRRYIISQVVQRKCTLQEVRALVSTANSMPPQDEAIEAGLARASTPVVHQPQLIACAACRRPRELQHLQFVRVCNDGCSDSDESISTAKDHQQ